MSSHEWRDAPVAQYAVVGDPVAHSLSPQMQNAAFKELGMDDEYVAVRVPLDEFDAAMDQLSSLGYKGVNVTVPLKEAAFKWAASTPDLEKRMGVVNALYLQDRVGINTDAPGFLDTLNSAGIDGSNKVLMLGAGGTTRSFAVVLDAAGYNLHCWNRTREKLLALLTDLRVKAVVMEEPDPTDCKLILNTTSASMAGEHLPVQWDKAPPGATAYDVYYTDGPTTFIQDALAHNFKGIDGRALLVAQGARSFEWWTGKTAPREAMLKAVE